MFNSTDILQIISSLIGTFGFGILFNIKGKKLLFASLGGALSWFFFIILYKITGFEVLSYLLVSVLASCYSEIMARIIKTPVTTFNTTVLIPLIPGSALYYSLKFALEGKTEDFVAKASYTLSLSAALAVGIIIVNAIARQIKWKSILKHKSKN